MATKSSDSRHSWMQPCSQSTEFLLCEKGWAYVSRRLIPFGFLMTCSQAVLESHV